MSEQIITIDNFSDGINEYIDEDIAPFNCSVRAKNCIIQDGSLIAKPVDRFVTLYPGYINSVAVLDGKYIYYNIGTNMYEYNKSIVCGCANHAKDYVNFLYKNNKSLILTSSSETPFVWNPTNGKVNLKNRRPVYNTKTGALIGWEDANGNIKDREEDITTYAPNGDYIELFYDRLWIAGNSNNPDRLYFSTAGQNGADIEDWTAPVEEGEANMHGGFIDVRSYDGSKIIGLKVVFNSLIIFKNKSAYKLYGSSPDNFEIAQVFSSNGAIANNSIVTGNNGCFYLASDGVYYYDGTNTNLISQKLSKTFSRLSKEYAGRANAIYYDNKYILSMPIDGSTENNCVVIYDVNNKSWMTYDTQKCSNLFEFKHRLYFTEGEKMYEFIFNSDGGAYHMLWETPMYSMGTKNSRKNINYVYFTGKGGKVKFTLKTERKTKSIVVPLSDKPLVYRKKLKNKGRWFKLIIENVYGCPLMISAPQLSIEDDAD